MCSRLPSLDTSTEPTSSRNFAVECSLAACDAREEHADAEDPGTSVAQTAIMADNNHLATYLNDHLAGAAAAIELLQHLETAHAGTPTARHIAALRVDIEADRDVLTSLTTRMDVPESRPRKAAAWLAERLVALKLRLDDSRDGAFRLFESLEAISLGIEGKSGLWRTLATLTPEVPAVGGPDYEMLIVRATDQRKRAEALRLEAARPALTGVAQTHTRS